MAHCCQLCDLAVCYTKRKIRWVLPKIVTFKKDNACYSLCIWFWHAIECRKSVILVTIMICLATISLEYIALKVPKCECIFGKWNKWLVLKWELELKHPLENLVLQCSNMCSESWGQFCFKLSFSMKQDHNQP